MRQIYTVISRPCSQDHFELRAHSFPRIDSFHPLSFTILSGILPTKILSTKDFLLNGVPTSATPVFVPLRGTRESVQKYFREEPMKEARCVHPDRAGQCEIDCGLNDGVSLSVSL